MWSVNPPVDANVVMIEAAESYAFYAALVSLSLIVAAISIFLFVRHDTRSSALAAATLCVHPVWTFTNIWYDYGAALRLASTIWIFVGCGALAAALWAVYRHRKTPRETWHLRFTSQSLLMITVIVAIVMVLIGPPIADEIPVSRSLPAVSLMFMVLIALRPRDSRLRDRRPTQVAIPSLPSDDDAGSSTTNEHQESRQAE